MKGLTIAALALAAFSGVLVLWQGGRISELEAARTGQTVAAPEVAADARAFAGDDAALLRSLQGRVSRLEAELVVLRSQGSKGAPTAVAGEAGGEASAEAPALEVHEIREQVDALMVGEVLETEEGRERLKELVQETRRQERQERMERWQESRKRETEEEVARLAEEHDLSNQQAQQISGLMSSEMTAMGELFRQARESDRSHREIRTEVRQIRVDTDEEVRGLLTEDQFAGYEAMRDEMGGPGRRRR